MMSETKLWLYVLCMMLSGIIASPVYAQRDKEVHVLADVEDLAVEQRVQWLNLYEQHIREGNPWAVLAMRDLLSRSIELSPSVVDRAYSKPRFLQIVRVINGSAHKSKHAIELLSILFVLDDMLREPLEAGDAGVYRYQDAGVPLYEDGEID